MRGDPFALEQNLDRFDRQPNVDFGAAEATRHAVIMGDVAPLSAERTRSIVKVPSVKIYVKKSMSAPLAVTTTMLIVCALSPGSKMIFGYHQLELTIPR